MKTFKRSASMLVMATALLAVAAFSNVHAVVTPEESAGLLAFSKAFIGLPEGWNRTNFDDVCLTALPEHMPSGVRCLNGHVSGLIVWQGTYNPAIGLSSEFAGLSYLKTLNLAGTNIDTLPSELSGMTSLVDVSWGNNDKPGITMPTVLGQMPQLKTLRLMSNAISSVPDLSGDTSLEILEASWSSIVNFDGANVETLTTLKQFICARCSNLTHIPNMAASINLELIDVAYSEELTSIPDMFSNFVNFAQFGGTGCKKLSQLPPSFGTQPIYSFNCGGCSLNQPNSIPNMSLSHVAMITLSDNGISTLPPGFCTFNKALVNTIDLSNNLLSSLPSCLSEFTSLGSLDLTNNNLAAIPFSSFSNMGSLYSLKLGNNALSGALPDAALAGLPSLSLLTLNDNQFTGPLPYALFHKSGLGFVDLSNNRLNGTIPDGFFVGCPLSSVMIEGNDFHGPFPSSISAARNVGRISAARNRFTSIPDTIGSMGMFFQWLDFADNNISYIPAGSVWENQKSLMNLYLQNNPIGGPLPTWWVEAPVSGGDYICYINLTNCGFTGTLPALNSQHLNGVWLSGNKLTGWEGVTYAPNLNYLYLNDNKIRTALTPGMANLNGLNELDLSNNKIPGTIPNGLSNIQSLKIFKASHNRLTGSIPSLANMLWLKDLDLSSNFLNLCSANPSFHPNAPVDQCYLQNNNPSCSCTEWYTAKGCQVDTCPAPQGRRRPHIPGRPRLAL